jgi:ribosomal protein S18 acetylase RimI-like enzyme
MRLRPATDADLPEIAALQRVVDVAWFGSAEHDDAEVREEFELADAACVLHERERLIACGLRHRTGSSVIVDPTADVAAAHTLLLPWLAEVSAPEVEVLDRDRALRAALEGAGWRHTRSAFELHRPVSAEWRLPEPMWPDGVEVRPYRARDAERLHRLVYDRAGWAQVPGHHAREFGEWRQIFLDGRSAAEAPVVAWRGQDVVGTAIRRLFSDGTGWIGQLAVARGERGRGLGRALLLEGFRRCLAAGATALGLGVIATNRGALRLYLDIGLRIDREWQVYAAPQPAVSRPPAG